MLAALAFGLAGCGGASSASASVAHWQVFAHVRVPTDVQARADGSLVVAADARLLTTGPRGHVKPFASPYRSTGEEEPYIALAPAGCFGRGTIYALKVTQPEGIYKLAPNQPAVLFAAVPTRLLLNGIAFDSGGRFGRRLLVTASSSGPTTVYAIGCRGRVSTLTSTAPRAEGGIAIAPAGFGRFGGDLIAPDELSGRIYALAPTGRARLVAVAKEPHGQDVGVESLGFLPSGGRPYEVFVSDRLTPGSAHPGDNEILSLSSAALMTAGASGGDLLAATEGGDRVDAIACRASGCQVRRVALGPRRAHGEGHIAIVMG